MKVLLPLMTYSSPSRTAVRAHGLEVAAGARLGHGDGEDVSRRNTPSDSHFCFCSSVPTRSDVRRDDVGVHAEGQAAHARRVDFLVEHGRMAEVAAAAAVFGRAG